MDIIQAWIDTIRIWTDIIQAWIDTIRTWTDIIRTLIDSVKVRLCTISTLFVCYRTMKKFFYDIVLRMTMPISLDIVLIVVKNTRYKR